MSNETSVGQETATAAIGDNNTVALQGTASSPGDEAGPYQIIDLLPPRFDGKIYTGWISFTATKPILVGPLHSYNVANETLDPDFGQLFVFPGVPNGTMMLTPAITMPDCATQDQINSDIPIQRHILRPCHSQAAGFQSGGLMERSS
jgi:hypothetical protein